MTCSRDNNRLGRYQALLVELMLYNKFTQFHVLLDTYFPWFPCNDAGEPTARKAENLDHFPYVLYRRTMHPLVSTREYKTPSDFNVCSKKLHIRLQVGVVHRSNKHLALHQESRWSIPICKSPLGWERAPPSLLLLSLSTFLYRLSSSSSCMDIKLLIWFIVHMLKTHLPFV